jgi:hypothetical protein
MALETGPKPSRIRADGPILRAMWTRMESLMIKTLALIKRRDGIDRVSFREHYETTHVPLALPVLEGLLRYARYHIESNVWGDFRFDVLTAFWYRHKSAMLSSPRSPSSTMRIFSSGENFLRVRRRISRIAASLDCFFWFAISTRSLGSRTPECVS